MLSRTLLLLALAATSMPSSAESVWVGGGSGAGSTRVAYLGRVAPLPGQHLGDGWSQAVFFDRVHYEYEAGNRRIDGDSSSVKGMLLRELALEPGTLVVGGGLAFQHVSLSPEDPGNGNRGNHLRGVAEVQWRSHPDRHWASQLFSQYTVGARNHYANGFLGRRLNNGLATGIQLSTGGDPTYRIHGLALAARGWRRGAIEWSVHAGIQHQEGQGDDDPEIGISFSTYRP